MAAPAAATPDTLARQSSYASRHHTSAQGEETITPGCCTKFFVKFPWLVALITGVSTVGLSVVGLQPLSALEPKNTGWTNRQSLVIQSFAAFEEQREKRFRWWCYRDWDRASGRGDDLDAPDDCGSDSEVRERSRRQLQAEVRRQRLGRRMWDPEPASVEGRRGPHPLWDSSDQLDFRKWYLSEYKFVYDTFGAGVLDEGVLASMTGMERSFLDFAGWGDYCILAYSSGAGWDGYSGSAAQLARTSACAAPLSLLTYLHANDAKHEEECRAGFCYTHTEDETEDPDTYAGLLLLCDVTSESEPLTFPTYASFTSSGYAAVAAASAARQAAAASGDTDAEQDAAARLAAAALIPADAADSTGFAYRGYGRFPCVSRIFDWRDGTLRPQAEWAAAVQSELCVLPFSERANHILSERRNASGDDMTCDGSSAYARTSFRVGWPLYAQVEATDWGETARTFEEDDTWEGSVVTHIDGAIGDYSATPGKARAAATSPSAGKPVNIFWVATLGGNVFNLFIADFIYSAGSVGFIFFYLWFNVGSLVLALAGLFEILCSFPLALFFWRKIMQQNNIDFLTFVGFFLILCVGADDIFVFMDTWKASRTMPRNISGTMATRFAWTWRRAAATMFTTTLTTAISLVCTAASPVPAVKAFGVFGALLIVADYILVITWFPAVVLMYAKACGGCESCEARCCLRAPRGQACCEGGCGPNTKFSDEPPPERGITRFLRDRLAPMIFKARFALVFCSLAVFAGSVCAYAFGFEKESKVPLFKASHPIELILSIETYDFQSDSTEHLRVSLQWGLDPAKPYAFAASNQILPDAYGLDTDGNAARYAADFDFGPAAQQAIVAQCEAAHATAGSFPTKLVDTASGPADYPLRGCYCLLNELRDWVTAGATPTAAAQPSFPFASEAALIGVLHAFVSEDVEYNQTAWDAVFYAAKLAYHLDNGAPAVDPVATAGYSLSEITTWYTCGTGPPPSWCEQWDQMSWEDDSPRAVAARAANTAANAQVRYEYLERSESGFDWFPGMSAFVLSDDGTDILGYYASFNSTIPPAAIEGQLFGGDVNILQPAYDEWARLVEAQCTGSAAPCVFTSDHFTFMSLLSDLADFALSTVLICLAASFVVLVVVTANVGVAFLATFCVTIVIFATLACIILAGFKNGMYESIFTILVVGMAIDYAVHLAHFYNEAVGSRYEKAQAAVHGVGVSVLGGAITTMGAGVPLFLTVVIFFWTLANYIFFVAMTAILLSFAFLVPMFMICGPQDNQGDLRTVLRMCGLCKPNPKNKTQPVSA